ncbi:hypothetical protein BBB44_15140 [Bordetella bronchiseptica]|nr:hypothetical protein BBB44_15140 [Bordetella bronchiseptica]AZW44803.1 hypothetical protein CWR61_15295 [Bordetella bronchiseptica]
MIIATDQAHADSPAMLEFRLTSIAVPVVTPAMRDLVYPVFAKLFSDLHITTTARRIKNHKMQVQASASATFFKTPHNPVYAA